MKQRITDHISEFGHGAASVYGITARYSITDALHKSSLTFDIYRSDAIHEARLAARAVLNGAALNLASIQKG